MFVDAIGLILADDRRIDLGELTLPRALAAVPFGGRYRIVDFMLSNLVNTGVTAVGVSTFNKYKSLMDHLGTGASWDLDRKNQGLSIIPPYVTTDKYYGNNDISGIFNFVRYKKRKHVIICGSSVIMNIDFNRLIELHDQSGADMTLLYAKEDKDCGSPEYVLEFDRKNILKSCLLDPQNKVKNRKSFLDVMIIERELFVEILSEALERGKNELDFQSFLSMHEKYHIRGVEHKGYYLRINSIQSYFTATMDSLSLSGQKALFWSDKPIYTKVKDEAPSYYSDNAEVKNSMISDGCVIDGNIEHSLLFRGVSVSSNTVLKNCIIFQNAVIGDNCYLENCIIDKYAYIRPGVKLIGESQYPVVIKKNAIV